MVKPERAFFVVKPGDSTVATATKSTTHSIRRKNSRGKSWCVVAFNEGRLGTRASGYFQVAFLRGMMGEVIGNVESGALTSEVGDMPKKIESISSGHHGASVNVSTLGCTSKKTLIATVNVTIGFRTGFLQGADKEVHMMKSGNVRWDILKRPCRFMCPGHVILSSIKKRK
jgi:hypothetical protein